MVMHSWTTVAYMEGALPCKIRKALFKKQNNIQTKDLLFIQYYIDILKGLYHEPYIFSHRVYKIEKK